MKLSLGLVKFITRTLMVALHLVFLLVSVVLALPFIIFYWLLRFFTLFFPQHRGKVELPKMKDISTEISLTSLLGPNAQLKVDAVFEGGGVKAIAQVGAIQAVEQLNLKWDLLGGTSGGAIMASMLAAGKKSHDIWGFLAADGIHRFVDVWYLPRIAFLQKRLYLWVPLFPHLMFTKGMVSGGLFLKTMSNILQKDGKEIRFKDFLYQQWNTDPKAPRHRLKMVATDISQGTPIILPDDLSNYWEAWENARILSLKPANELTKNDAQDWWPVAKAVRMSMSIPFFFEPVSLHLNVGPDSKTVQDDHMGKKGPGVLIVDGGVSSNFPIWLFDRLDIKPLWPTFGFLLDEKKGDSNQQVHKTRLLNDLAMSVIFTGIGAMDKRLNDHDRYRTATLQTLGVTTTQFGIQPTKQIELVKCGFHDTVNFFKLFDWNDYLNRFRKPANP